MIYTTGLKLIHVLLAATWFGTVVASAYIWTLTKQGNKAGKDLILKLISRVENIASIGIMITAVLMLIDSPDLLKQGWVHTKLLAWLVAVGLMHASKAILKKETGDLTRSKFDLFRSGLLLSLIIAITLAVFKPF